MSDEFKLLLKSGKFTENPRERIHTITNPNNSAFSELKVQLPIAYEGPQGSQGEKEYTPEHYFLAAIAGCFFTTFSVVCSNSNFNYKHLEIDIKGYIGESTGVKMMEKIKQNIKLIISSSMNEKKAYRILEMTENRCPLAKSIKSEVINTYQVINEE
ncbi:MAG: hypothetical protein BAJALOKI1v1_900004 [Promethearchaeota archaeon]|nr:MAG: hypothetical protein BAJALOKI1v1_900004 [Candidatus Lokiarchaeota archaeon]